MTKKRKVEKRFERLPKRKKHVCSFEGTGKETVAGQVIVFFVFYYIFIVYSDKMMSGKKYEKINLKIE